MAITEITAPQTATPTYNDLYFDVTSTNKNEQGFRYIAEVFIDGVKQHVFKIAPLPSTRNGRQHLTKLIGSYLTYAHLFDTTDIEIKGSYVNVKIQWGEEYSSNVWDFDDYGWAGSTTIWTNFNNPQYNPGQIARTNLLSSDEPPFSIGDLITINQTVNERPELNGVHKIIDIEQIASDEWMAVLELSWVGSGPVSPGSVNYADGTKLISLNEFETDTITCWNGALGLMTFKDFDYTDYLSGSATSKFLTNVPRSNYRVRPDSQVYLQLLNGGGDKWLYVGDNSPVEITSTESVIMIDCSPGDNDDYSVYLTDGGSGQIMEEIVFSVDDKCYGFTDVEICFLDRLGSILPFQFHLKRTTNLTVNKENYQHDRELRNMYEYSLIDAGEEVLHVSEEIRYTLRTSRLSTDEAKYFKELLTSPFTVVRFGDGEYVRCSILSTTAEIKDEYFDTSRDYDIDIKLSIQDKINW